MNSEERRRINVRDLIGEIDKTEIGVSAGETLREVILSDFEEEISALTDRSKHLREQRASLHPNESCEDARRRLQNPRMLTSYPQDRARALIFKRFELRAEVAERKQKLCDSMTKLEIVNAELEPVRETMLGLEKLREFPNR